MSSKNKKQHFCNSQNIAMKFSKNLLTKTKKKIHLKIQIIGMVVFYIFQIYIVWMEQSFLPSMNDEFSDAHCELIGPHEAEDIYLSLPSCFRSPQKEENILNSQQDQCCLPQP